MTFQLADNVKETTTSTGTGTISLGGAASSSVRTFVNGIGNGNTTAYKIDDGNGNWENTFGVITSGSPDTLTRGTLISSSTGSRITFAAGSKSVSCVPMPELVLTPAVSAAVAETAIASATTTDLGTVTTLLAQVTGTTTITGFGTAPNSMRIVRFSGALILTHNATSLILLSGANRTTVAGDVALYISDGSGNWREYFYNRGGTTEGTFTPTDASGASLTFTSPVGFFRRTANTMDAWGSFTYPSTADGNNSLIGSLPATSANLATNVGGFVGKVFFGGGSGKPGNWTQFAAIVNKGTTQMTLRRDASPSLTNSELSTASVDFHVSYPL